MAELVISFEGEAIHAWDLNTATLLTSYKNNNGVKNGLQILKNSFLLAIQNDKPAVHVWIWQKVYFTFFFFGIWIHFFFFFFFFFSDFDV